MVKIDRQGTMHNQAHEAHGDAERSASLVLGAQRRRLFSAAAAGRAATCSMAAE